MKEAPIEKEGNRLAKRLGWDNRKLKTPDRNHDPDRMYLRRGRVFFIEYKRPGKDARPAQKAVHEDLRAQGFDVWVVDQIEQLTQVFRNYE